MKFKFKNTLLVSFLAIAGIFGISSALINKQVNDNPVIEKADAWGSGTKFHMKGSGNGLNWSESDNPDKFKFTYSGDSWGMAQYNSNSIITLDAGTQFRMFQKDDLGGTAWYSIWTEVQDSNYFDTVSGSSNNVLKKPLRAYFYFQINDSHQTKMYWSEQKCTITYKANGGTGSDYVDPTTYSYKTNQNSISFATSGFTAPLQKHFTGWNTSADGSGTAISAGSSFEVTGDMTLYAQWEYHAMQYSLGGSSYSGLAHNDKAGIIQNYYTSSAVTQTKGDQLYLKEQTTVGGSYTDVPTSRIHLIGESDAQNFIMSGGRPTIKYAGVTGYIDVRAVNSSGTVHYYVHARGMDHKEDGETYHFGLIVNDGTSSQKFYSTTSSPNDYQWIATVDLNKDDTVKFINASTNVVYYPPKANTESGTDMASFSYTAGSQLTCNRKGNYTIKIQSDSNKGDTVYIARNTWTVSYDMHGHGDDIDDLPVTKGGTMSAPSPTPEADGYTFGGWYTTSGYSAAVNFSSPVTADMTIHAKWTANTYTVSYANGGHGTAPDSDTATYDDDFTTASAITGVTGYTFDHWSGSNGTDYDADETFTYTINGALTLTAVWNANIYTITLDNQSATSSGTAKIYEKYAAGYYSDSGASSSISSITKPSKTGCTFGGYYTSVGGSGNQVIDEDGDLTEYATNTRFTDDTTIYAKWSFTVTYNSNGGSGSLGSTTLVLNHDGTLATNTFTRDGHIFNSWNKVSGGSGTSYSDGASLNASQVNALFNSSGTVLYAQWTSGETAAIAFATGFNGSIGGICKYDESTNKEALASAWGSKSTNYSGLPEYVKYWLDEKEGTASSDSSVTEMFAKYKYVYGKYGTSLSLTDFLAGKLNAYAFQNYGRVSPFNLIGEDNFSTVIIVIASSVALLSVTVLSILVIRKRKSKEQ